MENPSSHQTTLSAGKPPGNKTSSMYKFESSLMGFRKAWDGDVRPSTSTTITGRRCERIIIAFDFEGNYLWKKFSAKAVLKVFLSHQNISTQLEVQALEG